MADKMFSTLKLVDDTLMDMGKEAIETYCLCQFEDGKCSLRSYVLDAIGETEASNEEMIPARDPNKICCEKCGSGYYFQSGVNSCCVPPIKRAEVLKLLEGVKALIGNRKNEALAIFAEWVAKAHKQDGWLSDEDTDRHNADWQVYRALELEEEHIDAAMDAFKSIRPALYEGGQTDD